MLRLAAGRRAGTLRDDTDATHGDRPRHGAALTRHGAMLTCPGAALTGHGAALTAAGSGRALAPGRRGRRQAGYRFAGQVERDPGLAGPVQAQLTGGVDRAGDRGGEAAPGEGAQAVALGPGRHAQQERETGEAGKPL